MVRVPINKYRDNICFITEKLKQSGTKSILLTAPTAFYFCGVPDYIVSTGLAHDKNSAITQHREYNEIIRDIAKNQNRHLLDAERIINKLKNPNGLFLEDRIHFSSSGLNYMADLIYSYLKGKQLI